MDNNNDTLTCGKALHTLYKLSQSQFGGQSQYMATLFGSYHDWRTQDLGDCQYQIAPSMVSEILRDLRPLPKRLCAYYTAKDSTMLCRDLERYFAVAVRTERQQHAYTQSIAEAVRQSTNILPGDKKYILAALDLEDDVVCNLWFRALYVLLREPVDRP